MDLLASLSWKPTKYGLRDLGQERALEGWLGAGLLPFSAGDLGQVLIPMGR